MILVPKPIHMPTKCAALGRSEDPEGFFDTGSTLTCMDPHIYVSVGAARHMADKLGYVKKEDYDALLERQTRLTARLQDAEEEARTASAAMDAIHVIESKGFRAKRKPGRPPKEVAANGSS